MRVSLKWIASLLGQASLGIGGEELADRLSRRVAEIDGVSAVGGQLDGVVVGRVLECQPHPDADRLRCCVVDIGAAESLPIVCGAANVAAGQAVAVAVVGTTLRMTKDDGSIHELTIKKGKLRGQPSHGMICAEDELGLGTDHSGIMVLSGDPQPGTPLAEALGMADEVLEIDNHNINHRPDLWGHIGWAREIAAVLDLPFTDPCQSDWQDEPCELDVEIETAACSTYCGAVVSGLRNQPSPAWMVQALEAVGSRSRGLLVDITNYVMLELGEPMHAFDRRAIAGSRLRVREARDGETMTTLDERQQQLRDGDVLISDANGPLALAGIMGGAGSMVRSDTDTIVLEAAIFAPDRIRRTRLRLGQGTESSSRFEKGLPPEIAPTAINRAIALLRQIQPQIDVRGRFHQGQLSCQRPALTMDEGLIRRLGGIDLEPQHQQQLLQRLGIMQQADGSYAVPWWRQKDLTIAEDLVEEVLRQHGYEHLIEEAPRMPVAVPQVLDERRLGSRLRQRLSACGWDEVQTYVFTDPRWIVPLAWPEAQVVRLVNAPASDQSIMRRSLLPLLLEAGARNHRFLTNFTIYELGRIYGQGIGPTASPDERSVLAGLAVGGEDNPFYVARDAAIAALASLQHSASVVACASVPTGLVPGRCADLLVDGLRIGEVGEVSAELRELVDLEAPAAYFSIDLLELCSACQTRPPLQFQAPTRFQQVRREFTWICPEELPFASVAAAMEKAAKQLSQGVELVTVYRGDPIPSGHKALSMRLLLAAQDRTLGEKDLNKVHQSVIQSVERQTAARLRQ
ncbi:MAG: phenylalanine--tRNA ligase subunit beta [Planctomycetota bacterium]|nr:MAG: phenylalanine--tRNA ligase subunit beta [Planctomycetota bacterium]